MLFKSVAVSSVNLCPAHGVGFRRLFLAFALACYAWLGCFAAGIDQRNDLDARKILRQAVEFFQSSTNFSASVDLEILDRKSIHSPATRGKEAWRFTAGGGTNRFERTRFLPLAGREVIESDHYSGGILSSGHSSTLLPGDAPLPGFEVLELLSAMSASEDIESENQGSSLIITARLSSSEVAKAWFSKAWAIPFQVTKSRGDQPLFVLKRNDTAGVESFLPRSDSLHFYENGRVATTLLRTYSTVAELGRHSALVKTQTPPPPSPGTH